MNVFSFPILLNMEPVKVLTIGDPHFKVGNIPESEPMTDKLVQLARKIEPTFIVCLGDILHRHEKIHVSPLMRAEKMIELLSEIAPTFLIIGNHDRPNNSNYLTDEHPFNAMKKWKNTYVVDKVVDANIKGNRFIFVPYVPPGKFDDALNTIETPLEGTTAVLCHQEFYGAKMGPIVSQAGDKWPLNNPLVISGHIHDYDRLQTNIIYVGTPMQHAFGDGEDKTVSLFYFDNKEWKEERIDLGLTKRLIVYLTPDKIHTYDPPTDKIIKIVIKGDEGELKAISKLDKIKQLKKSGVKISFKIVSNTNNNNKTGPTLRMKFSDRLYSEIRNDKKQIEWFNKMFK